MSDPGESFDCRKCKQHIANESPDNAGWCRACRRALVKRSNLGAIPAALLVAVAYAWVLSYFGLLGSSFMIVFIAIGVVLAWVAFKVARRVLFDVLRNHAHRVAARR
jgi:hypothetical protein